MTCTLMHKRLPVAELELDDATGFIQKVNEVYAPEHLPVGVHYRKGIVDRAALNGWWTDRSIPASRSGVREALEALDISNTKMLLIRCYGLSLSDQYWICPSESGLTWEQINFFDNSFSDDMGDVLFGQPKKAAEFDFSSPDNTSDGCLKKRWKIIDGKRCLIKGGSNPFQQQPFNEVIASGIMERLHIPHIPYTMIWSEERPYSICEDFVSSDTELVSAWRIMQTTNKSNSDSVMQHFIKCCDLVGAPDVRHAMDQMIVIDYLIANEDRHLNNFGLIRNAETLEWVGAAPIFDSGSSLGYDKMAAQIRSGHDVVCKPFKKHHDEQLKLVRSFDWIDFAALEDVGDFIREVFTGEQAKDYVGSDRIEAIVETTKSRVKALEVAAMSKVHSDVLTSTMDDVEENIAEDYTQK